MEITSQYVQAQDYDGPTILLTQQHTPSLENTYAPLKEYFGAQIDFRTFTESKFLSLPQFRIHKPTILAHTTFLFTSRVVIDGFFKLAKACSIFLPKTTKYFLAREALQNHLGKYVELYKRKIFWGDCQLEDLFTILHKHKKEKFLFPCSNKGRKNIRAVFKKKQYHYTELPFYHKVHGDLTGVVPSKYDVIVFFSPTAVEAFSKHFPNYPLVHTKIAAFGSKTIQAVEQAGWSVTIAAPTLQTTSMVAGLIDYFDNFLEQGSVVNQQSSPLQQRASAIAM